MKKFFQISIILPAFNEQDNLKVIAGQLVGLLKEFDYKIIFIDDGSQDNTLEILKKLREQNSRIHFLSFSRNFGHQNALKAGLDHADGDCLVFMDCDLQHPPGHIIEMIELWQKGYEIVYTRRQDEGTPFLKRQTTALFYRVFNHLSEVYVDPGRADFFLIDRKVAEVLKNYHESPLFFRGILPWIGFKQTGIVYKTGQRFSGVSKYSFKRMLEFAVDGITSFSTKPLRASIYLGTFISLSAFVYLTAILYLRVFDHHAVTGWKFILAGVFLLGGIQLFALGVIGEYLGKLFMGAKKRPSYIIRERS